MNGVVKLDPTFARIRGCANSQSHFAITMSDGNGCERVRRDGRRYPSLRFAPYPDRREEPRREAVWSGPTNVEKQELKKKEATKKVMEWVDECDKPPPLPWKDDAPPCPIHERYGMVTKEVDTKYGKARLHKCPHPDCFISCFGDDKERDHFLYQVSYALHWQFREPHCPMVCFCGNLLSLKMSHSKQNPDRLFFGCRQREGGCKMFMWGDDMAPQPVREHWDWWMSH